MKSSRWITTLAGLMIAASLTSVQAHDSAWVLGGFGTASVDGILSPGEWSRAGRVSFDVNVPAYDGGGTIPAQLLVMNDAANLYVAFRIGRGTVGAATNPALFFDADHDTVRATGDDGFGMSVGIFSAVQFFDTYVRSDGNTVNDSSDGGTTDGLTAASDDGAWTYVEMSHPLDSLDDAHDFSLAGGDVIGFGGLMNLFAEDPACDPNTIGGQCQAFTDFAGSFTQPLGDIIIVSATPGACERGAHEARQRFVDSCLAAGGSRSACNRAGNEILLAGLAACRAP